MPLGRAMQITYGVAGKAPTGSSVTMGGSSQILGQAGYDAESGLSSVTDANSLTSHTALDGQFDLSTVVDRANQVMHQFVPNPSQRTVQTIFGTGSKSLTLTAQDDVNGNVRQVTGTDGRTTTLTPLNSDPSMTSTVKSQDSTGSFRTDFTFDSFGRVTDAKNSLYDPSGQAVGTAYTHEFSYDSEDHVLTDGIPGLAEITYAYNSDGTRSAMYVKVGRYSPENAQYVQYSYGYDGDHRVTSIVVHYADQNMTPFGGVVASAAYTYDADGRVAAVRTPLADTFYAYDALGRLSGLENVTADGSYDAGAPAADQFIDPYNGNTHTVLSAFSNLTYDILGDLTGYGYLAMSTYSGGVVAPGGPAGDDEFLEFPSDAEPENAPVPASGGPTFVSGSASWGYDPAGRLAFESWSGAFPLDTAGYGYDAADNLTTRKGSMTVDLASDQLTNSGFTFDASGDQLRFGGYNFGQVGSFTYDAAGHATGVAGASNYPGATTTYNLSFTSDESGRRRFVSGQTYPDQRTWTDEYRYDGDALVYRIHEQASDGSNVPSDLSTSSVDVLYLWGPTGPVMEFDLAGNARTLTYEPRGDCVATSNGRTVQPVFFDAYGEPINPPYANDDRYRQQPLQYKGQSGYFTDAYSGFDYCLHRYYSPAEGRWTQRDPAGLEGGINVYGYCAANPVMGVDPSGTYVQAPAMVAFRLFGWSSARAIPVVGWGIAAASAGWEIGSAYDHWSGYSDYVGNYLGGTYAAGAAEAATPAFASLHTRLIRQWRTSSPPVQRQLEAQYAFLAQFATFFRAGVTAEVHHLLPQKLRNWFRAQGIANIDDPLYLVTLATGHHKDVHGRGGLPSWNAEWEIFQQANQNATVAQILHQLRIMRLRYGI